MPFYHTAEATKYLKAFIGEHYYSDETSAFKALWRNYNFCQFVEDEGKEPISCRRVGMVDVDDPSHLAAGDVLFYRNRKGQAARRAAFEIQTDRKSQ
jgi:omega-6 fatty acid desaturase (delta-12 desaturase)